MRQRFQEWLAPAIERLLTLIDRDAASPTYGCCYPPFWRGDEDPLIPIPDFVNARWQEAGLSLAQLYLRDWPGNAHYRQESTLELAKAVLRYWAGLRKPGGSFAEWRGRGHEQPPTASSAAALARAFALLSPVLTSEEKKICLPAFRAAAEYLVKHPNLVALQYEAAAADALFSIHGLLPQFDYAANAREKIARIRQAQSPHGWLAEQDGPDLGAGMNALCHLALYQRASQDETATEVLGSLLDFLQYFIYPDGVCGGGCNTLHAAAMQPAGFALLREKFPAAAAILPYAMRSLMGGAISAPDKLTGQFLALQLHKFLLAAELLPADDALPENPNLCIPADNSERIEHAFDDAAIDIVKTPHYYAVFGPGGSIAALYSYRNATTLMLSSRNQLEAASGLIVLAAEDAVWTSMRREAEQREKKEHWLQSACRVNFIELLELQNWASASERYPFRFMSAWSRLGSVSSRALQRLKIFYGRSFLPMLRSKRKRRALDPEEHFLCTRRLHWQDGAIHVQNLVAQKTRERKFKIAAICEPLFIPHRDEALYSVEIYRPAASPSGVKATAPAARNATPAELENVAQAPSPVRPSAKYALPDLRHGTQFHTDRITLLKNDTPVLDILLDGSRQIELRWYRTPTQRDNPLRYLEASSLQLQIDIQPDLQANWKSRLDYTLQLVQDNRQSN